VAQSVAHHCSTLLIGFSACCCCYMLTLSLHTHNRITRNIVTEHSAEPEPDAAAMPALDSLCAFSDDVAYDVMLEKPEKTTLAALGLEAPPVATAVTAAAVAGAAAGAGGAHITSLSDAVAAATAHAAHTAHAGARHSVSAGTTAAAAAAAAGAVSSKGGLRLNTDSTATAPSTPSTIRRAK
jgi:hypothetical protein